MALVDLPTLEEFDDGEGLVEALAEALRSAPLGGVQTSVTQQVTQWAELNGVEGEGAALLAAYNESAQAVPASLREELELLAADPVARRAVISLLGRTGTSDAVRMLVLEAFPDGLERADLPEFARLNIRQRPQVMGAAVRLLAATEAAEAMFVLLKALDLEDPQRRSAAGRAAGRLARLLPEAQAVSGVLNGEAATLHPEDLDKRELLYVLLSLSHRDLAGLAESDRGRLLVERIETEAAELDRALRAGAKRTSGLNPYEMRVRDELHDFVLIAGVPSDEEVQKRAGETLFRRADLQSVEALAPYLRSEALAGYAARALTPTNRRGERSERALLALEAVRQREPELRRELRGEAAACLAEKDPALRCEAARLLAADESELPPDLKAELTSVYNGLPRHLQQRLGRDLEGVSLEALDNSAFLQWVEAARGPNVLDRLTALLTRWAGSRRVDAEDAREFMEVFGARFATLEPDQQKSLIPDLLNATSGWLRGQGTSLAGPIQALTSWQRYRYLVAQELPFLVKSLRSEQCRRLLSESLGLRTRDVAPSLVAEAASAELPEDAAERILRQVLVDAVRIDLSAIEVAFVESGPLGRLRLLESGLSASVESKRRAQQLKELLAEGTTQALIEKRSEVLEALSEAEDAAAGNDRLVHLLGGIRKTLVLDGAEVSGGQGNGAPSGEPAPGSDASPDVARWRSQASDRFVGVVERGSGQLFHLARDLSGRGEELANLITELDRRAHSKRAAPPADRPAFRHDLRAVLSALREQELIVTSTDGSVEVDERLGPGGERVKTLLESGRPELRALFWESQTAPIESEEEAQSSLGPALARAAIEPETPSSVSMLDVAIGSTTATKITAAVEALEPNQVELAWRTTRAMLDLDFRKEQDARERERGKEQSVGRAIAEELAPAFETIEQLLFSYFRLREQLAGAGWRRVEDRLGRVVRRKNFDPISQEIRGSSTAEEQQASDLAVRSLGIKFQSDVVRRAILQPLGQGEVDTQADE